MSWLSTLKGFDLIRGTTVDYMHCVRLGVCRQLFRLWLNSTGSLWYIGPDKVSDIDRRLLLIKPPDEIHRTPRSIKTTVKYWKGINYHSLMIVCSFYWYTLAHELRAWLLHYSPVVLYCILHQDYYQHHLLLVDAIYTLLKDCVSTEDLKHASRLLQHYCYMFAALYGIIIIVWFLLHS